MINIIVKRLRFHFRQIVWKRQLRDLSKEHYIVSSKTNAYKIGTPILIIAPHADDELIGCHQLMVSHPSNTTVFYCGFLGSNLSDDNRKIREDEIRAYADLQHYQLVISTLESIHCDLKSVIIELQPSMIFVPSFIDWHPEHRQVNLLLSEVIKEINYNCIIGWYHVSLPIPASIVNSISFMKEDDHKNKWLAMSKCYPSQLHMDIKRFKFIEKQVSDNSFAAETYFLQTKEKWLYSLQTLRSYEEKMCLMKDALGNMFQMYNQTNDYYKLIR